MRRQKEKFRKHFQSPFAMKRIRYLGINLPKKTKDLYIENFKTLMTEIKKKKTLTQIDGEIDCVHGLEELI